MVSRLPAPQRAIHFPNNASISVFTKISRESRRWDRFGAATALIVGDVGPYPAPLRSVNNEMDFDFLVFSEKHLISVVPINLMEVACERVSAFDGRP